MFRDEFEDEDKCDQCCATLAIEDFRLQAALSNFGTEDFILEESLCATCTAERLSEIYGPIEPESNLLEFLLIEKVKLGAPQRLSELNWSTSMELISNDRFMDVDDVVDWLDSELTISQILTWCKVAGDAYEAAAWIEAGIEPEYVSWWEEWGVSASEALEMVLDEPSLRIYGNLPNTSFKNLGFTLEDARELVKVGIDIDYGQMGWAEDWASTRLTAKEIVEFVKEIKLHWAEMKEVVSGRWVRWHSPKDEDIWEFSRVTLGALKEIGLDLSIDSLKKYLCLSRPQILNAIDAGLNLDLAGRLPREGVPHGKEELAAELVSRGLGPSEVSLLLEKGFSEKHLATIDRRGVTVEKLWYVAKKSKCKSLDEVIKWSASSAHSDDIDAWIDLKIGVTSVAEWTRVGFRATSARLWIESGVTNPDVAARRRDAGIRP